MPTSAILPAPHSAGEHRSAIDLSPEVRLTRMESTLLHWLRQYPRECLTREFLMETVWGYEKGVRSRTLDVHIRRLRRKLGPVGQRCIKTIFRDGYCWYPAETSPLRGMRPEES